MNPGRGWHDLGDGLAIAHGIAPSSSLIAEIRKIICLPFEKAGRELALLDDHFAFVYKNSHGVIAAVDRIRSFPLLYCMIGNVFHLSNDINTLLALLPKLEFDPDRLLEFRMAGYVTGQRTMLADIKQMEAGSMIACAPRGDQGRDHAPRLLRYYRYLPNKLDTRSEAALVNDLTDRLKAAIDRLIRSANGAPIWVPLSGGLDSRLVAGLLHQKRLSRDHNVFLWYERQFRG